MREVERMWRQFVDGRTGEEVESMAASLVRYDEDASLLMDSVACEYLMFVMSGGAVVPPMPEVVMC